MELAAQGAHWTLGGLRRALAAGDLDPVELAELALSRANRNAGGNTYLWQQPEWTLAEARHAAAMPRGEGGPFGDGRPALWGLPVSLKDCFDLAGAPTSCGVRRLRDQSGLAKADSWMAERLRAQGAVIVGKTHLHPVAWGITGENPDFGDCLQPANSRLLTGGSSSGAAASVQEGSAALAVGTDTGGSLRAPAALCRLASYRASLGRGGWAGAAHLAESFDTLGFVFRDLEDTPLLTGFFASESEPAAVPASRFATIAESFLAGCEPGITAGMEAVAQALEQMGLARARFEPAGWREAFAIFSAVQSREAAGHLAGQKALLDAGLQRRLEAGERISDEEHQQNLARRDRFAQELETAFAKHQILLMPACPVAELEAGADHGGTRVRLLRYTTPFSLAGVPVVTVPCSGGGVQMAAWRGGDRMLAELAARLGRRRRRGGGARPPAAL